MNTTYYRIVSNRQDYKGERYFAVSADSDTCVQVCRSIGVIRGGTKNAIGLTLISRMTFLANYLTLNYVCVIDRAEFAKAFNEVVKTMEVVI